MSFLITHRIKSKLAPRKAVIALHGASFRSRRWLVLQKRNLQCFSRLGGGLANAVTALSLWCIGLPLQSRAGGLQLSCLCLLLLHLL